MKSLPVDYWIPGQETTYYPEGSVIQTPQGVWYVRRDGNWHPITEEEAKAME